VAIKETPILGFWDSTHPKIGYPGEAKARQRSLRFKEEPKLGKKPSIAEIRPLNESQQLSTKSKSTIQASVKTTSSKLTVTSTEIQSQNDKRKRPKMTHLEKPVEFSLEESEVMKAKSKEKLSMGTKTKPKQEMTSCQLSMPVTKSGKKNYDTRPKEKPKDKKIIERKSSGQSFEDKNWSTHSKDQKNTNSSPKQLSKISSSQSDAKLGSAGNKSEKVLFFERVDLSKQKEKSITRSSHNLPITQKPSEDAGSTEEKKKKDLCLAESLSSGGDRLPKPRNSNTENSEAHRKPVLAQSELLPSDNYQQRKSGEGSCDKEKPVFPREITRERDRASQRLEEFSKGSRNSSSRSPTKIGKAGAGVKKDEGGARSLQVGNFVDKGCMTELGGEELGLKLLQFEKFKDIFKVTMANSRRWRRTTRLACF
jgi:archaellin